MTQFSHLHAMWNSRYTLIIAPSPVWSRRAPTACGPSEPAMRPTTTEWERGQITLISAHYHNKSPRLPPCDLISMPAGWPAGPEWFREVRSGTTRPIRRAAVDRVPGGQNTHAGTKNALQRKHTLALAYSSRTELCYQTVDGRVRSAKSFREIAAHSLLNACTICQ